MICELRTRMGGEVDLVSGVRESTDLICNGRALGRCEGWRGVDAKQEKTVRQSNRQ